MKKCCHFERFKDTYYFLIHILFKFQTILKEKYQKIFFFFEILIKLKLVNSLIILLVIIIVFSNKIKAQDLIESKKMQEQGNQLLYGLDKIANTYIFKLNGNYSVNVYGGKLDLFNQYKGTYFSSTSGSFRDDENLSIKYNYPLSSLFSIYSLNTANISSDSRSIGLNKLERINTNLGFRFDFNKKDYIQLSAGFEKNTQLDISSGGSLFKLDGEFINYQISDYYFNTKFNGEYLGLNFDRKNYNFDIFSNIFRNFDNDNKIIFNLQYKMLNRAYISPLNTITLGSPLIENRLENRLQANLEFNFALTDFLHSEMNLSSNNILVSRDYNFSLSGESQTKIIRDLQDLQLSFYFATKLILNDYFHKIGLSFNIRNEINSIDKKFEISKTDEDLIKALENQRDNSSNRTRLFSNLKYNPSSKDTISSSVNISLYQYDTPSSLNYDDRDEFNIIFNLSYSHFFNNNFTTNILLETQHNHLVFLKQQRSGQNNWNRIIRLAPSFLWRTDFFTIAPQFEVLANYTAYDYEDAKTQVKSFSFRQIGYKDSIFIYLNKNLSLQFSNIYKYSERGILNWSSFSESPQNGITEIFIKSLICYNVSEKITLASGIKYYSIVQESLAKKTSSLTLAKYKQYSIGPEALFNYKFNSFSEAYLSGWLEYQYINNLKPRLVPSLYLFTMLNL